jgi:hypothetical protein
MRALPDRQGEDAIFLNCGSRYGTSATPANVVSSFVTVITTSGAGSRNLAAIRPGIKASLEETAVTLPRKSAKVSAANFTALFGGFSSGSAAEYIAETR